MIQEEKDTITKIAEAYGFTFDDVMSNSRDFHLVDCRHYCIYIIYKYISPEMSISYLSLIFKKDRNTIYPAIMNVKRRLKHSVHESRLKHLLKTIGYVSTRYVDKSNISK